MGDEIKQKGERAIEIVRALAQSPVPLADSGRGIVCALCFAHARLVTSSDSLKYELLPDEHGYNCAFKRALQFAEEEATQNRAAGIQGPPYCVRSLS